MIELNYFITDSLEINLFILALISIGESIIIPIPPDILIIYYSLISPSYWFYYSSVSLIFSIVGGFIGYEIGKLFTGKIESFIKKENIEKVKNFYDKYGNYAIFLAGFSPIPYKIFTLSSGILRYDLKKFIIYSTISRGLRFYAIGFLSAYFGEIILKKINEPFYIALTIIIGVLIVFIMEKGRRYLNKL